jgi:hypothetical protein
MVYFPFVGRIFQFGLNIHRFAINARCKDAEMVMFSAKRKISQTLSSRQAGAVSYFVPQKSRLQEAAFLRARARFSL